MDIVALLFPLLPLRPVPTGLVLMVSKVAAMDENVMSVSLNPHKIPCQAPVQTGEAQIAQGKYTTPKVHDSIGKLTEGAARLILV